MDGNVVIMRGNMTYIIIEEIDNIDVLTYMTKLIHTKYLIMVKSLKTMPYN